MARASFLAPLVLALTLMVIAQEAFPAEAKTTVQPDSSSYHNNLAGNIEPTTTKIANLSCQELSDLGNAVNKVLLQERKTGDIRKLALVRAQQLAGEAEDVGGLFSGPIGFFRRFLSSVGWIKVKPPENVITLSIESDAAISAIGEVAGQWLKEFVPGGQLGAAIVTVLSPVAKLAGKEWATKDIMEEISYFSVTEAGIGTLDVIYDKKTEEAFVNIYLEDLTDEWKAQYGWEDERIYMYVPFESKPPELKMAQGRFEYRVVFKSQSVVTTGTAVPPDRYAGSFDYPVKDDNPNDSLEWKVIQGFGEMNVALGGYHSGEDWNLIGGSPNADLGKPVFAIGNGNIKKVSSLGKLGYLVAIEHEAAPGQSFTLPEKQGKSYYYPTEAVKKVFSVYVHVMVDESKVFEGAWVKGGSLIGTIMNPESGSHLHFEIRRTYPTNSVDWSMVGHESNWAVVDNKVTGYYIDSQEMIGAGLRDPSGFIKANKGEIPASSTQTNLLFVFNPRFQSIKDLDGALIIGEQTNGPSDWIPWANIALRTSGVSARFGTTALDKMLLGLTSGTFDALLVARHPWLPLNELTASGQGRFLSWSSEAVNAVTKTFPDKLTLSTLPANTYNGQNEVVLGYAPKAATASSQTEPALVVQLVDSRGDVGKDTSLAFNKSGNPAISYYDSTNQVLKFAEWDGRSWHNQTVDAAGDVGTANSLAFDQVGNPAIAYYDSDNKVLKYAQRSGTSWSIVSISSAYWSYRNSLAFDASGRPVVAYYDYPACDLKYARFDGSKWVIQLVYHDGRGAGWGRTTSLAMDSSGSPGIAFREPHVGLRYAHWNGTSWEVKTVDNGYGTGADASLRFGPKGYPAIAYWWQGVYGGPSSLKSARFNGTSWNTETLETDSGNPSLAFDRSGNPAIAYYHVQDANLKYARWDGSHWRPETIDSAGDVGTGNSLAFDAQGNPAISYYDKTNGDLKFAILR